MKYIIAQVFGIVAHLIHGGDAILMFPLVPTNMYAVSSNAPVRNIGVLYDRFKNEFPGNDLFKVSVLVIRVTFFFGAYVCSILLTRR